MQATARREKRRLLDAQRGKCRVRLGSHLEEWCALKDQLGFEQHAQLAKFLLDRYISTSSLGASVPKALTLLSVSLSSLKRLAFLCHQHGRDCPSPPTVLSPSLSDGAPEMPVVMWGCKEHQFKWHPHDGVKYKEAGLAIVKMKLNTPESLSDKTEESICLLEGQTRESQGQEDHCEPETSSQVTVTEPTVSLCDSYTTFDRRDDNNIEQVEESIGEQRLEVLAGNIADERHQEIASCEEQPTTTKKTQTPGGISAQACQQEKNTVTATEEPIEKRHSERIRSVTQGVLVPEVAESCSITSLRKEPQETPSGRTSSRCQRAKGRVLESDYGGKEAEPKAALLVLCRRSPRGRKKCKRKTERKVQVSYSRVQRTACKTPTEGQEPTLKIAPETIINEICPIEESIVEEVIEPNVQAEDLDSLSTAEEQPMVEAEQSPSAESVWKVDSAILPTQMPANEPPLNKSEDQQGSRCKAHKVIRLKPNVDEELSQICKKRIRKVTPPELLMCDYENCGKIFSKRQYLNYHQKYQHMNQRTFRCSVPDCGKTFNFKKHLKEHEKRHSDRRDFICEFCARAFRSSSNLIIHRRIHTGEKPLQCEFCGFTCRQKASLNWHMKKHDAAAFYQHPCDVCGQRFEKKDNLAAHKSRKHPKPHEGVSQPTCEVDNSNAENVPQTELAFTEECQETLTELTSVSQDNIKETVFSEYLDIPESVQEAEVTTQTEGSTEFQMVIVL